MATLTAAAVTQAGTTDTLAAAAGGGDKVAPRANQWIEVLNGGGSSITVTVDSQVPSNYGTDVDLVVSVGAGVRKKINISDVARFTNQSDGLVSWSYSGVTSVTVGVFYL